MTISTTKPYRIKRADTTGLAGDGKMGINCSGCKALMIVRPADRHTVKATCSRCLGR